MYQTTGIYNVTIFIMLTPVAKQFQISCTIVTAPMWKIASIVRDFMNRFSLLLEQISDMCLA
jgi:hypothetical protein